MASARAPALFLSFFSTTGGRLRLGPQQQPAERERVDVLLELLLGLARRGIEGVEEDAAHGSVTRVRINRGHVTEHQRRQPVMASVKDTCLSASLLVLKPLVPVTLVLLL